MYDLDNIHSVNDNRTPSVKVRNKQTLNEQRFLITVFWDVTLRGFVIWNFPNLRAPRPTRLLNRPDRETLSPDRRSPCSYRGTTSWSYDVQSCSGFHDRQRSSTSWRCRPRTCWTSGMAAAGGCTYFELVSIAIYMSLLAKMQRAQTRLPLKQSR